MKEELIDDKMNQEIVAKEEEKPEEQETEQKETNKFLEAKLKLNEQRKKGEMGTLPRPIYNLENPETTDRVEKFLYAFDVILKHTNYRQVLELYSYSMMKCGKCSFMCQVYDVTRDPKDIPCYRSHLLIDVYNRYFKSGGWIKGIISVTGCLTEDKIDEMIEAVFRCMACRRCTIECPLGIDHGLITHLMRYILSETGLGSKSLIMSAREEVEGQTWNSSSIPLPAMKNTVEFLEEDIEELKGVEVKFNLDKEGVEWVFIPPAADFLVDPEALMGMACIFHAAGDKDNWTIGTKHYDSINYGLFYNDWVLERLVTKIVEEVNRIAGQKIMIGECGHATRTAFDFIPLFGQELQVPVYSWLQYTCEKFRQGKLKLNPNVIKERVTYHDPCNLARRGRIVDEPRKLIKSFISDFVEKKHIGVESLCCGGGGGIAPIPELVNWRMEVTGVQLAEELLDTSAYYVITPCANCKNQIKHFIDHYDMPMKCVGLMELIMEALIME